MQTASCSGPCKAGYFCDSGSTSNTQTDCPPWKEAKPDSERAKYYCKEGETRRIVDSGYYTIPEGDAYLDHREAQLPCPDQYHCVDGLAKPKLLWAADNGCASSVVGEIMTVEKVLSEGQQPGGSMPAGWVFTATTNGLPGGSTVSYKISKCPKGCTGNAFVSCGSSTGAPFSIGTSDGQMGLSNGLNAEACTTTYKIQIKATAKDSSSNILATAKCNLNIAVGDVNEAPSVDAQVRYIEEESPENTAIGEPLIASDPEVAVNKQELIWSITACNNNGADVSPCPIKISFCSGQLSVSDPTNLTQTF